MQPQNGPPSPRSTIRGLALPGQLGHLLASGLWQHPGDHMLHTALPWFESPVDFLTSTECMERETQSLDMFAQDDRSAQIFHVTRGSTAGPKDLPWLDAESAILIAVNRVPGDDVAIALDYRPNAADPAVVASDAWTNPPPPSTGGRQHRTSKPSPPP